MSTPPRPRQPQLPPFCRRAHRCHTLVSITSLRQMQRLLWLALIFQLSSVLLITAGPVPQGPKPFESDRSAGLRG
jgi:hypothetical protein